MSRFPVHRRRYVAPALYLGFCCGVLVGLLLRCLRR